MEIKIGRRSALAQVDKDILDSIKVNKYYLCNTDRGYIMLKKYLGWKDGRPKYEEIYLHRYIMNPPKGYQVDHINGDRLDNRRINLRICTGAENVRNQKMRVGLYKGVYKEKRGGRWIAQITQNHKCYYIGTFDSPEDAALAYNEKAKEMHGAFAYMNIVPTNRPK